MTSSFQNQFCKAMSYESNRQIEYAKNLRKGNNHLSEICQRNDGQEKELVHDINGSYRASEEYRYTTEKKRRSRYKIDLRLNRHSQPSYFEKRSLTFAQH